MTSIAHTIDARNHRLGFQIGVQIDYTPLVLIRDRLAARLDMLKYAACTRYHAAGNDLRRHAARTRSSLRHGVLSGRDSLAAALLGIPATRLPELRAIVLNPPLNAPPTRRQAARVKTAEAISAPATGAGVQSSVLTDAIRRVARVSVKRPALPILSHVLLTPIGSGCLRIEATNLDAHAYVDVPAAVVDFSAATVDAKLLLATIKGASGTITLSNSEGGAVTVSTSTAHANLESFPCEEFPVTGAISAAWQAFPGLVGCLEQVLYACSADETRPILNGVKLEPRAVVGSDTHRLAVCRHICGIDVSAVNGDCIIPADTLTQLARILSVGSNDLVNIAVSSDRIAFRANDTTVTTRRIEGAFPNYQRVIPATCGGAWMVETEVLRDALQTVAVAAKDYENRTVWTAQGDALNIRVGAEDGRVSTALAVESEGIGSDFKIALSARYMLDIANAFRGCKRIRLGVNTPSSPILATSEELPSAQVVLMPMEPREED